VNKEILEILIEKYALNKLSPQEKEQLDELIVQRPEIKKELMIRKDIAKSMEHLGKEDLRKMLNKIHHEEIDHPKRKNFLKWLIPLILFAGLVLFFLLGQLNKQSPSSSASELYASYYEPYKASSQTRGETIEQILSSFYSSYEEKNYAQALNTIKPVLINQKNDVLLLAGISAMETNDSILALKLFNQILESNDYYYSDHANWYKALMLIKENKTDSAKATLQLLVKDKNADHHKEAKNLLGKLK